MVDQLKRPDRLESTNSQNLNNSFIKISYSGRGIGEVRCGLLCVAQKHLAEEMKGDWTLACVLVTKACPHMPGGKRAF